MSVGYGFAVMCIGIYLLAFGLITHTITLATAIMAILFIIYGYRLGGYILKRELTNAHYRKKLESTGSAKAMPLPVSLCMWFYSMWMYTAQTSAGNIVSRSPNFIMWPIIKNSILTKCIP